MKKTVLFVLLVAVVVLTLIGAQRLRKNDAPASTRGGPAGRGGRGGGPRPPVPVVVSAAATRDMPVYLHGLGSVQAFNTVTVRSRVDGQLMEVMFQEGQEVKQGQLLAVIDPRPFQVQLQQAEATLAKDQATLADATLNYKRYQELFKEKVIAAQQVDTQRALMNQYEGQVAADGAVIENAKLQLTYSRITSPIGGRVGLRLVDAGNIVHANDQNGLLVITQMQPIAVIFTLPEDELPAVLQHMRRGTLSLQALSRDDTTQLASGKLLTINNEIDPTTGTYKLKGVFQNEKRTLWPNQFVNIRLLLDVKHNAIVVPSAAVQRGNQGTFVYVVKPDSTAEMRAVQVGISENNIASIEGGLQPGEQVVTDGQDKLVPGGKVQLAQGGHGPGGGQFGRPGGQRGAPAAQGWQGRPEAQGAPAGQGVQGRPQ